jgi:hypothetical protein
MKTNAEKTVAAKIASWSIIGLVAVGTMLISGIADVSPGSSVMARVFFFFLSAIIVVQVIPGLMLLGAMLKAIVSLLGKVTRAHPAP